jgi:hypothetical protein
VRQAQPHGSTALNNAFYVAMKQFARAAQQAGEVRRQAIAVLSDGEDTSSVISFDDVLAMARKSGINIYYDLSCRTAIPSRARERAQVFLRVRLLDEDTRAGNGALSYFPQTVQELKGIYAAFPTSSPTSTRLATLPRTGDRWPLPPHRRKNQLAP